MTDLVLFIAIFLLAGAGLLLAPLLLGKLIRPNRPSAEKGAVYECGEPAIGTAWVQFDLRFYVVALLFVIFDVELAFFFPWAVVFGSATRAADESLPVAQRIEAAAAFRPRPDAYSQASFRKGAELEAEKSLQANASSLPDGVAMRQLARVAFADILIFFGVLLVGFAYLWRRGDLEWVRSYAAQEDGPANASRDPNEGPVPSTR